MKDYDVVITIGTNAMNEDMVMDNIMHILHYIQKELPLENYNIKINERGAYQ